MLTKRMARIEGAIRHAPPRLFVEAVNEFLTDLAGPGRGAAAARQEGQQIVGARRLHVAVRLDRLHAEPSFGDEGGEPPHDVGRMYQVTQHRADRRLQRVALEQGNGDGRVVAIENNELPARLEHPSGLRQSSLRVGQMGIDRMRENKVKGTVRLLGRRRIAGRE